MEEWKEYYGSLELEESEDEDDGEEDNVEDGSEICEDGSKDEL